MPQGAEQAGFGIVKGDGADACDALAEIDAQPGAVVALLGRYAQGVQLAAPTHRQCHRAAGLIQSRADILGTVNGSISDGDKLITDFQSGAAGSVAHGIIVSSYCQSVTAQLQADDLSYWNEKLRGLGMQRQRSQQRRRQSDGAE